MSHMLPEPPPRRQSGRGKYDWQTIVEELTSDPGKWMLVDDEATRGMPSVIKRDKIAALRDPEWEFHVVTRNNNKQAGTCELWMSAQPRSRGGVVL